MAYQDNSVISLAEVANVNRQDHTLQLMPIQSLQIQNIWFTQSHQGDEDDPIVPPN
ncbi:hypothetical protein [Dolichospermum circinale]|jgi:hypothetical protein|uniref:hypothetical protein n=1 Tax=Dolichospermum circinale TaxID=109265 RepID=UPI00232C22E3|nr:hypothetical protein [Dolichospermum circinale]MBO1046467.1 hypothetical protein [Dolichospermum sp. DEX182a]MDB9450888.1 hypothetical protein [Dolichospermum circinale CS-547]